MATKPNKLLNWVSTDDPAKLSEQSQPTQDAGFISGANADPLAHNWLFNRISKWLTYINELVIDQIDDGSTYGKVKLDSLTSNEVDHDKILNNGSSGVHGVSGDVVGTSDNQTLTTKTIDADNNTISNLEHGAEVDDPSTGVHGVSGDIVGTSDNQILTTKTIDADNNTISNLEHGAEVDNPSSGVHGVTGDVVGTSDNQILTTKTIDADNNTISNLEHGSEVDDPATGVHGVGAGDVVGTTLTQALTNKTLTSPKINEDVVLTSTSSEIDAAVAGTVNAISGDNSGRFLQKYRVRIARQTGNVFALIIRDDDNQSYNTTYNGTLIDIDHGGTWEGSTFRVSVNTDSFKFTIGNEIDAILSATVINQNGVDITIYGVNATNGTDGTEGDYVEVQISDNAGSYVSWLNVIQSTSDHIEIDILILGYNA